ncbi:MAG: DUF1315 family protein [Pseudomonadota bacterium]
MNYEDAVKQISPELYATFKRSLEVGRWPDGRQMTAEQREHCLQAIIAYDALHTPETKRVGHIAVNGKADAETPCSTPGDTDTLRWAENSKNKN